MSKHIFITGAGSGIGAETARMAVGQGHRVSASDVDLESVTELASSLGQRGSAFELDIRDAAQWETAFDRAEQAFGHVDVLINNAAVHTLAGVAEISDEWIRELCDVNFVGTVNGTRAALRRMESRGSGHIMTTCSLLGFITLPGQVVYSATKHAIRAFHHGTEMEWKHSPIRFSIVYPPAVETPMLDRQLDNDWAAFSFTGATVPASDVAEAIVDTIERPRREVIVGGSANSALRYLGVLPRIQATVFERLRKTGLKKLQERRAQR